MAKLTAKKLAEKYNLLTVGEVKALQSVGQFLPKSPVIVNVGAGKGTSALAFLEAYPDAWLTTVDRNRKALDGEYAYLFASGLNLERYTSIRNDSIKAARNWERKNIDVLLLDGAHNYEYVREEIELWSKFVVDGGFIFIHDYGVGHPVWQQVKQAVDEWREQEQIDLYKRERIMVAVRIPSWGRDLKRHEVQHYVNLLHTGKPFGLARYGDGEWRCILGEIGGKNSNGCTFTEEICDALRKVLHKNSSYEHAVLRIARDKLGKRIGNFLSLNGIKVEWTIGNTFLDESFKGKLWPLIAALRKRKIVYVGPEYLRPIKDIFFKYVAYVEIPPIDAYKEQGRIIPEMLHAVEQHEANLVGFSAGHHKHLFAEALWKHFNEQVSFIDFGCIWDGYLGKKSRKFLRKGQYDWKELQRLNVRRKL